MCKDKQTLIFRSKEFGELVARQGVDFAYTEKTGQRLICRIHRLKLPDRITEDDRNTYARYTLIRSEVMDQSDFKAVFDKA